VLEYTAQCLFLFVLLTFSVKEGVKHFFKGLSWFRFATWSKKSFKCLSAPPPSPSRAALAVSHNEIFSSLKTSE